MPPEKHALLSPSGSARWIACVRFAPRPRAGHGPNKRQKNVILYNYRAAVLCKLYSGIYGRASVTFYAFNTGVSKGIACRLNNLQKKDEIASMRAKGCGYAQIAQALGVSKNTVKSYCRRNSPPETAAESGAKGCPVCGKAIDREPGRKEKKFCSDVCRRKWWNAHPEQVKRKAVYTFTCPNCGKAFTAYGNSHRKYCSHDCYIAHRFKGGGRNG